MSNAPSGNGSAHASPCTYVTVGIAAPEERAVVEAERRDLPGPAIVLLEVIVRRAAGLPALAAEAHFVGSDVEHGRFGRRLHLVEEEAQLVTAGAQGDGVGERHRATVASTAAAWGVKTPMRAEQARVRRRTRYGRRRRRGHRHPHGPLPVAPDRARWPMDGAARRRRHGYRVAARRRPGRRPREHGGRARAGPLDARARRRHGRVPPPFRARPADRRVGSRACRLPAAAARDGGARDTPRDRRPADRVLARTGDRALRPARLWRTGRHAIGPRASLSCGPPPPRPRLAARLDAGPSRAHDRPRAAPRPPDRGRSRTAHTRARDRPVVGRRDRARRVGPLRPRHRR